MTTLVRLADHVGGRIVPAAAAGSGSLELTGAATLETATTTEITLVDALERLPQLTRSKAAAAVVPAGSGPQDRPTIEVEDVHAAFVLIIRHFRPVRHQPRGGVSPLAVVDASARLGIDVEIHPLAVIGPDVEIAAGVTIHAGVRIEAGCRIGAGTEIFPNAVLYSGTVLGDRCRVHAAAVLGADGFGYRVAEGSYRLSAQLGWVEVGDDVEIGAGTTIDRGTYGPTTIGQGTKIDNQVMIAHNCRIGRHNMICSQVGVAGSTSTGDWVVMAGQCGVRDHVHIGDGAVLGARSGVSNDVPPKTTVLGEPAIDLRERKLQLAAISKLPEMRRQLKQLTARIEASESAEAAAVRSEAA
jgi:UDP-3-O-[3-hydroxymyristoyl] glucosamine N-acyltransferase